MTGSLAAFIVLIMALTATTAGVALYIYYGRLILRSRVAGTPVGFNRMLRMTLSGLDAQLVVIAYLDARKAGVEVTLDTLETLARAKSDPRASVRKLIAEKTAGIEPPIEESGLGNAIIG